MFQFHRVCALKYLSSPSRKISENSWIHAEPHPKGKKGLLPGCVPVRQTRSPVSSIVSSLDILDLVDVLSLPKLHLPIRKRMPILRTRYSIMSRSLVKYGTRMAEAHRKVQDLGGFLSLVPDAQCQIERQCLDSSCKSSLFSTLTDYFFAQSLVVLLSFCDAIQIAFFYCFLAVSVIDIYFRCVCPHPDRVLKKSGQAL